MKVKCVQCSLAQTKPLLTVWEQTARLAITLDTVDSFLMIIKTLPRTKKKSIVKRIYRYDLLNIISAETYSCFH